MVRSAGVQYWRLGKRWVLAELIGGGGRVLFSVSDDRDKLMDGFVSSLNKIFLANAGLFSFECVYFRCAD
jgi:hypothetical protein